MKSLRKILIILIMLAAIGVGVLFALQNKVPVSLDLLVYTFEPRSLALWVLVALALGGLLGMLISSVIMVRMRVAFSSTKRQLARERAELDKLRSSRNSTADSS